MLEHLHERLSRTIQNGHLNRVNVDEDVVNTAGVDGRKQMFGGREQNTLLHQAGGIADACDVVPFGLNRKIVEVHPTKNDPGIRRRRD